MTTLNELLRNLEQAKFFGSVELKYEAGRLVLIRKTETLKPPFGVGDDCRNSRGNNDEYKR